MVRLGRFLQTVDLLMISQATIFPFLRPRAIVFKIVHKYIWNMKELIKSCLVSS